MQGAHTMVGRICASALTHGSREQAVADLGDPDRTQNREGCLKGRMKRSYLIPAILTLLSACIGVLTNIGSTLIPTSWKWIHDGSYVWGLTGTLLLVTILVVAYQEKFTDRKKVEKSDEFNLKDGAQDEPAKLSVSMTASHLNVGTVLQASNSIVNLYESGAAPSGSGAARKSSGEAQHEAGSQPIWNVPPRLAHFTGRKDIIEQMRTELSLTGSPNICTLFGLGGVGKTSLAIEYAYQYADHYSLIWWINADESRSIVQQLARLATRLSLREPTDNDRLTALLDYLQQNSGWMLIFDNLDDPREISHLVPSGVGNVLITTRRTTFGSLGKTISVEVLHRKDSIAFLQKRRPSVEKEKCNELAEALGDLPLALEQVAAYLDVNQVSLTTYLHLWKTRSQQLLERGQVLGHEHTIATVWNISVEKIAELSPAAVDVLNISAFFAPSVIPSFLSHST